MLSPRKFQGLKSEDGALVSWSSTIPEDDDFPQGRKHCL